MKACPYCAEQIHASAIVCKHCGRDLTRSRSQGVAALLSLVLPGAGQIYKGHVWIGLLWLLCTVTGYTVTLILGVLVHLLCVLNASRPAPTAAAV